MVLFPPATMSNKFRRALKTAALLPVRAAKGSNRGGFTPAQGELPIVVLRVHVVGCSNLTSKDKNGFSDPLVSSFLPSNSLTQFFPGLLSSPFSIPVNKHLSPNAPSTLSTLRKMLRLIFPFIFQLLTSLVPWNSSFGTKTYFRRITWGKLRSYWRTGSLSALLLSLILAISCVLFLELRSQSADRFCFCSRLTYRWCQHVRARLLPAPSVSSSASSLRPITPSRIFPFQIRSEN